MTDEAATGATRDDGAATPSGGGGGPGAGPRGGRGGGLAPLRGVSAPGEPGGGGGAPSPVGRAPLVSLPEGLRDLCERIERQREEGLLRQRGPARVRTQPVASDLGPCARETALAILAWQDRPQPDGWLAARLARGSQIEQWVLADLISLGWEVRAERLPLELRDTDGTLLLRGRVDGWLRDPHSGQTWLLEIKSVSPSVWGRLREAADLDRWAWTHRWRRQLVCYLHAAQVPAGIMLLDDCLGHWRLLPVPADPELIARLLEQARTAVRAVERVRSGEDEATALPPYHPDPTVCLGCWAYGRRCWPPAVVSPAAELIDDPDLIAALEAHDALAGPAAQYAELDRQIKARLAGKPRSVIGARWVVESHWVSATHPAQPAREVGYWRTTIRPLAASSRPDGSA